MGKYFLLSAGRRRDNAATRSVPEEERALEARGNRKVHDRLNQNDVTNRINVEDPDRVRDAVLALFAARYPGADLTPLRRAFEDTKSLFQGTFPGYLPCDTLYHDLRHTLDMTLAMARLLDGHDRSHAEADRIGAHRAMLGTVVALLHDSGYLKRASEAHVENGAVFTKIHVSRSADFLSRYLPQANGPALSLKTCMFTNTPDEHFHVPLLLSPYGYTTYRGS